MAPPGKIYHWKHGWIPLDHYAQLQAATKTPKVTNVGREKVHDQYGGYGYASGDSPYKSVFAVEGAPDVRVEEYKRSAIGLEDPDILGGQEHVTPAHLTNAKKIELAMDVQAYLDVFPGLKPKRKQKIYGVHAAGQFMGETDTNGEEGDHAIAIDTVIWNMQKVNEELTEGKKQHFGIPNEASTSDEYRKRIVFHEMSHVLHLTSEDDSGVDHFAGMDPSETDDYVDTNLLNELADEPVTPREVGYTKVPDGAPPGMLDQIVPRWMVDALDKQSVYAVGQNRYEWLAEAIGDGYWNGDKASPAGKRAFAIAKELYGKAGK